MEWIRLDPALAWLLRVSLAGLFTVSTFHKLRDPRGFLKTLSDYDLLPPFLVLPGAVAVVTGEILVTTALISAYDGFTTGLAALAILAIYTTALSINLLRGRREIDCGCLGPGRRQSISPWMVPRNVVLAAGAALLCLPIRDRPLVFVDGITLFGGVLTLFLLFNAVNHLATRARMEPTEARRT